jgi:hypothetical protein
MKAFWMIVSARLRAYWHFVWKWKNVKRDLDEDTERVAQSIRELAAIYHIDARPVILPVPSNFVDSAAGWPPPCPKCGEPTSILVEPAGICGLCWLEQIVSQLRKGEKP